MKVFLTLILGILITAPVRAQLYKWVDAQGKIQYSDKPPPEIKQSVSVMNGEAQVKSRIETNDERNARLQREKLQKDEEDRVRKAKTRDNVLLSSYTSVEQIESKKQEALKVPETAIAALEARKSNIQSSAAKASAKDKEVLNRQLTQTDNEIKVKQLEKERVIIKYNSDIERYKELKNKGM